MCLSTKGSLKFRISKIKEICFFIAQINNRGKMIRTLNVYVTALNYSDKTLLVLMGASSGVFLCLFTTVIGTPVGREGASISQVLVIGSGIAIFLKLLKNKKISIALLARSKLNSIEK